MHVKVKDNPDLVRDMSSNAILNTNTDALQAYKLRKKNAQKVDLLEEKMDGYDKRLSSIEDKLSLILEKLL